MRIGADGKFDCVIAAVSAIELAALEDDGEPYENIEEIWPDYPTKDDFFFNEDEY